MPAAQIDFTEDTGYAIFVGETWIVQFTFYADEAKTQLVDFSNGTAVMQIRDSVNSDDVVLEINTEGSNGDKITLGGTNGTLVIEASAATTATLSKLSGVYDVMVTINGKVTRELAGAAQIVPAVTRAS